MAESTNIIAAVVAQWRRSTTEITGSTLLRDVPIRSTRIPAQAITPQSLPTIFPYCLVESKVINRRFNSGNNRLTWYMVTLTVYCGNSKVVADDMTDALTGLFDRNIGLPIVDNCVVLEVQAVDENPETDPQDFYGADINVVQQQFKVLLNETITAVKSALAT
jgi:hypothetical protein